MPSPDPTPDSLSVADCDNALQVTTAPEKRSEHGEMPDEDSGDKTATEEEPRQADDGATTPELALTQPYSANPGFSSARTNGSHKPKGFIPPRRVQIAQKPAAPTAQKTARPVPEAPAKAGPQNSAAAASKPSDAGKAQTKRLALMATAFAAARTEEFSATVPAAPPIGGVTLPDTTAAPSHDAAAHCNSTAISQAVAKAKAQDKAYKLGSAQALSELSLNHSDPSVTAAPYMLEACMLEAPVGSTIHAGGMHAGGMHAGGPCRQHHTCWRHACWRPL